MKTISQVTLAILFSVLMVSPAFAQSPTKANDLDQQFDELKKSSNSVKSSSGREYKVVNLQSLNRLWNDVQGLVAESANELRATQDKVETLNQEVASLTERVEDQQVIVQESEHAATHISVLGIDIQKDKFEAAFWITSAVLLILLGIAIYQYKRSREVTRRTQMNFMELQEEMEELRKTSLEKERRLRRELQTERNMMEEMGRNTSFKSK